MRSYRTMPAGLTVAGLAIMLGIGATAWASDQDSDKDRKPASTKPTVEVIASGLDNPRGVALGPDGALFGRRSRARRRRAVRGATTSRAMSATFHGSDHQDRRGGSVSRQSPDCRHWRRRRVSRVPGRAQRAFTILVFDERGRGIAVIGLGVNPTLTFENDPFRAVRHRFGVGCSDFRLSGSAALADDLGAYEADKNPDGGLVRFQPIWGSAGAWRRRRRKIPAPTPSCRSHETAASPRSVCCSRKSVPAPVPGRRRPDAGGSHVGDRRAGRCGLHRPVDRLPIPGGWGIGCGASYPEVHRPSSRPVSSHHIIDLKFGGTARFTCCS